MNLKQHFLRIVEAEGKEEAIKQANSLRTVLGEIMTHGDMLERTYASILIGRVDVFLKGIEE